MTNPNDPAFSDDQATEDIAEEARRKFPVTLGLTKREYFIAKAMEGILAKPHSGPTWAGEENKQRSLEEWAQLPIDIADAVIAQMNKKPKEK